MLFPNFSEGVLLYSYHRTKFSAKNHDKYQRGHIFVFLQNVKNIPQKFQTDDGNLEFVKGILHNYTNHTTKKHLILRLWV